MTGRIASAVGDFHRARQKAALQNFLAALTGKSIKLLSYDDVRKTLRPIESASHNLREIPLDSIVGSVNRYTDFTRTFLPLNESVRDRWARVRVGIDSMEGLPPIEVYQVGDVYFVLDGHHRVSVARDLGLEQIQAYVTPVYTRVPLSPGDKPDDLIVKAEYTDFLMKTRLDDLRPGLNLQVTAAGQYPRLLEHIDLHRYFMGLESGKEVPYPEAVTHWFDTVYQPVAQMINDRGLLRDFPGRTEADLYLWITEHRSEMGGGDLGWEVPSETAAEDLRARYSEKPERRYIRFLRRLQDLLIPEPLESGPEPGVWRREHLNPHRDNRLLDDLLVAVPGDRGWQAVSLAIEFARREEARLTGLHLVSDEQEKDSPTVQDLRAEFARMCAQAGVAGRMVVEVGQAARQIYQRSVFVDLVVFRLAHPPPTKPLARLRSGVRTLIRRNTSPLLAVPDGNFKLESALLAYGGGRKADEALFFATYLAESWKLPLTVLSVRNADTSSPSPIERARVYLNDHGVKAEYIEEQGDPARNVVITAEAHCCSLIIMGGYESGLLRETIYGSTVDRVMQTTHRPVLVCQ